MAGVKVSKPHDAPGLAAAPRARRLGWLLEPAFDPEPVRQLGRTMRANLTPAALWRKHRLFSLLVLLSVLPRVLAGLAFRPAELIPDSFSYMQEGVHLSLGLLRPAGYPLMLMVLEPFHDLAVVTSVQHVMGIAIAAIVYGLLRAKGLPAWGASLAAAPTLFDPRQIWLESAILPDTVFALVILISVALLLTERRPRPWQCAVAGLLMAWASILRGNGAPVIVAILIFMLVRRVGWRALLAGLAAFALPLMAYVGLFHADYGQYDITDSTGMFLWSRTMSFANCAVIKPPANLKPLCPDAQPNHGPAHAPPWSVSAVTGARSPADYLWAPGAWWRHDAHPGINAYNNKLAMQFALDAIKTQPLAYLRVTGRDVMLTFLNTDRPHNILALGFTYKPDVPALHPSQIRYEQAYAHTGSNTYPVQPYAYLLMFYQLPVYFPGWAFFLVIVAGLIGIVRGMGRWRRRREGLVPWPVIALPWASAVIIIVVAPALHEYLYRYAISAVPLACLAAGLAFVRRRPRPMLAVPVQVSAQDGMALKGEVLPAGQAPATAETVDTQKTGGPPEAVPNLSRADSGAKAAEAGTGEPDEDPEPSDVVVILDAEDAEPAGPSGTKPPRPAEGGNEDAPGFAADPHPGWGSSSETGKPS